MHLTNSRRQFMREMGEITGGYWATAFRNSMGVKMVDVSKHLAVT